MRKRSMGRRVGVLLAAAVLCTGFPAGKLLPAGQILASSGEQDRPFVALGADLKPQEREDVLKQLGVTEEELAGCTVVTVTNEEEHAYLDDYLDANVIGSRALSCVLVRPRENGAGLDVTTKNISYCTISMYRNALITAGVEDADITVAGPFPISGTAALIGITKAYEQMTGEEISEDSLKTAANELVLTGELGQVLGDADQAEQLIAAVKQEVVSSGISDEEGIREILKKAQTELGISLEEEDEEKIIALMKKVTGLHLDADALKAQAKDLYDKVKNLDLSVSQDMKDSIGGFFTKILEKVLDLVENIRK